MPTINPDTGVKHPKTEMEVMYLKENIIRDAIHQKLKKKDVYETNIDKI